MMEPSSWPTAAPQLSPTTTTATPTAAPTATPRAVQTAAPTTAPTVTAGCEDTFTLKGFYDSSFDGCYHPLGDGYGGGLTNPYFLDGVSDVDAYLSDLDGDLAESADNDLGPVFYIDSGSLYISNDHWVIARMEQRQSFSSPDEYYIYERDEYYEVDSGPDPQTIKPWEITWGSKWGLPQVSFSVTQGCSYCPPPWPSPPEVEPAPTLPPPTAPIPSTSSTGGGGMVWLWVGLGLTLGFIALVCWDSKHPTSHQAGGNVNRCATQGNNSDIAARVSVAAPSIDTDCAAAGTTAVSRAPPVLAAVGRVSAGATVIATVVPASSFVASGCHAPRSEFDAVLGNAGQPLPTAVAVPYGTGSELAQLV